MKVNDMAKAKQTIKHTRTKTKKTSSSGKKGNQKRCPTCGRFI